MTMPCKHITDPEIADWISEQHGAVCARCWLEGSVTLFDAEHDIMWPTGVRFDGPLPF